MRDEWIRWSKENIIQSDLCYITKKRTTSCFIDTLHFRILPAHLWMTAFANSHLSVLNQCNAVIISAVRIYGNLPGQFSRMLFLFLCIEYFSFEWCSLFCQVDILIFAALWFRIIFVMPPRPVGIFAAFGCWPARPSRLWGSGTGCDNKREKEKNILYENTGHADWEYLLNKNIRLSWNNIRSVYRTQQGFRKFRTC